MYQLIGTGLGKEEKAYTDATEYGIICKVQNLQMIVEKLDKYIKKTKVRGAGLSKRFGGYHCGSGQYEGIKSWSEWNMDAGSMKGSLTCEQGWVWHFELNPNRHYYIDKDDVAREVYAFPERKDLPYYIVLFKYRWFYKRNGQIVYECSGDDQKKRELFFQGLLDCIGFRLEPLHVYGKDEERIFR